MRRCGPGRPGRSCCAPRVRADTTVICANVAYPTDSGLLAKAVGKLVRAARRVQAAGGGAGTKMTDPRRGAARRGPQIAPQLAVPGEAAPAGNHPARSPGDPRPAGPWARKRPPGVGA